MAKLDIDIRDLTVIPGLYRRLFPGDTPTIRDQVKCPPGYRRDLASGGCVPGSTGSTTEIGTRNEVEDAFVAPIPPPRIDVRPPKLPPGTAPTPTEPPISPPSSPADVYRGFPSRPAPLLGAATLAGVLGWVLGTLVIGPYFTGNTRDYERELERTSTRGPPRRRNPPPRSEADDLFEYGRIEEVYSPSYRSLPDWLRPMRGPFPYSPPGRVRPPARVTTDAPPGRAPAKRPRTRNPRNRNPRREDLRGTIFESVPGVGYDPFTVAPPSPAPIHRQAAAARAAPAGQRVRFTDWFYPGLLPVRSVPRRSIRVAPGRTLTQQPRPSSPPLTRQQPFDPLTPLRDPVPALAPQGLMQKPGANPCTEQREARRRRQKDCQRYTTKEIRVCADK